jgi:hypothetical protein
LASPAPASDRRRPIAFGVVFAVAVSAAGGMLWWRARSDAQASVAITAPAERPRPAAVPGMRSEPDGVAARNRRLQRAPAELPSHEVGARVYAEAVAAGEKNPGEKAFRADAAAFLEFNGDLAEERAAKEGVTLDEMKELTYMGLLAMHIRRWDAVAHLAGHELSDEERTRGDELVFSASNAFKAAIRAHVAKGDPPEARWETIRQHQASFIEKFQALARISPEAFDRLLAEPFQSGGR